ncbi:MAG TPA: aldo/keto reductase [Polyangiaceae bacterium]|nr:aldo/keto reductase [Polyangiaceae bacterium]
MPPLVPWETFRSETDAPPLLLGAMNFGKRTPEDEAHRIVHRALERGVTFVDTANAYVDGESERIVGRALRGRRDRALVATKVGLSKIGGQTSGLVRIGGTPEGLSRKRILEACDESLSRLGMDHVDLYYLHVPDARTPIEETLSAIATLLQAGKIRAWGVSNYASWQVLEMIHWCDREGVPRPVMAQQIYNVLVRQLDVEWFAFARRYRFHTAAYNPLAGGLLARPKSAVPEPGSRFDENPMYQRRYWTDAFHAHVADYAALASEAGLSTLALAYGFVASRPGVDSVLVGPATALHLDDAIALCRPLPPDVLARVDELHRAHTGTDATYARL